MVLVGTDMGLCHSDRIPTNHLLSHPLKQSLSYMLGDFLAREVNPMSSIRQCGSRLDSEKCGAGCGQEEGCLRCRQPIR